MRLAPRLLLVVWLTVVWCALWGEPSAGNVLAGLAAGTLVVLLFPPGPQGEGRPDVPAILRFGASFAWALVVSNVTVAVQVLFPEGRIDLAIVAVPLRVRSPVLVSFVANAITLTPGTMTIEVSPATSAAEEEAEGRPVVLFVHCLDGSDPEAVRAEGLRLEELAVRAFGSAADRRAIAAPAPPVAPGAPHGRGAGTVNLATDVAFALLAAATLLTLVRLVRGPSLADRVVATDLFLTFLVIGAAVLAARTGEGTYLEAMLVVAIVGFLGTAMVARFIEGRGA